MSTAQVAVTTKKDWTSNQEVRWCPGCGDYAILNALQRTLPELGVPRENFVVISGIGCSGKASCQRISIIRQKPKNRPVRLGKIKILRWSRVTERAGGIRRSIHLRKRWRSRCRNPRPAVLRRDTVTGLPVQVRITSTFCSINSTRAMPSPA